MQGVDSKVMSLLVGHIMNRYGIAIRTVTFIANYYYIISKEILS